MSCTASPITARMKVTDTDLKDNETNGDKKTKYSCNKENKVRKFVLYLRPRDKMYVIKSKVNG